MHKAQQVKLWLDFALMNDTPYLALTGELWSAFHELFKEEWPAIYRECTLKKEGKLCLNPETLHEVPTLISPFQPQTITWTPMMIYCQQDS